MGWWFAFALYLLGAIEMWKSSRHINGYSLPTKLLATFLWPVFVPIALVV